MCGIAGAVALDGEIDQRVLATVEAMGVSMAHRGPDGHRTWSNDRVSFTHRRLAIIDLSEGGAQPKESASGRFVVTFNGEIYNYKALGDRLRATGWRNRTDSDTEVLLECIEQWGLQEFLEAADGMFAFALLDLQERCITLARDRFGEKPLSYCVQNGMLWFASEIQALEQVPTLSLSVDHGALADFFRFNHIPGTATIYREVRRLAPATLIQFSLESPVPSQPSRYWSPPDWTPSTKALDMDELMELLHTSSRARLVSDRPLGAFLSGGIDSSLTCALAAQHVSGALKTFTMGWENHEYDESDQAALVARALGAEHHQITMLRLDVVRHARQLARVMDEPFADSSQLAVHLVSAAAREKVVVAISGDGGDELFGGYNRHRWLLKVLAVQEKAPRWARRGGAALARIAAPAAEWLTKPIPPTRRPRLVSDKMHKLSAALGSNSLIDSYQLLIAQDPGHGTVRPLAEPIRTGLLSTDPDRVLWALRAADLVGYMSDDVLTKVDRGTMSVSLESRTPFLNRPLVDFALRLRADQLIGPGGGKQPLRLALAKLLPDVRFNQTKSGFGVPIADLLRVELRDDMRDAISTNASSPLRFAHDWSNELTRLASGDDGAAPLLWSLLMLEYWRTSRVTSTT